MKLFRVLRTLDDLAEILIFDLLLATPRRRRIISLAAGTALLAAYASSGFWMAPPPAPMPPPPLVHATVRPMPGLPDAETELAAEIVRNGKIAPARQETLAAVLQARHYELDHIVTLAGQRWGALAVETLNQGLARSAGIGTLLLARGAVLAADGEPSAAVRDWLAVIRLSQALTMPGVRDQLRTDLAAHAAGSVLENTAVHYLTKAVEAGSLNQAELAAIAATLRDRRALGQALAVEYRDESECLAAMFAGWAASNQLPAAYRGLRFYLPVLESNRAVVAQRAAELVRAALRERSDCLLDGRPLPERPACSVTRLAGWNFHLTEGASWTDRFATLWSNDRAATVAATLMLNWRPRAIDDYARACQRLEGEVATLLELCEDQIDEL